VAASKGVPFYDDSKGTNVVRHGRALAGFSRSLVLIAGARARGRFAPLAPRRKRARAAVV